MTSRPVTTARRVIGAEHISSAQSRGLKTITLQPGDIITDLARESALRLGIALQQGPVEKPAIARSDNATRTQRSLYQRSPKWVAPSPTAAANARRFRKLAIIGAGGVGANIAHLAANQELAQGISLMDIAPGVAAATALDLHHASGITGSRCSIDGGEDLALVADAEVVVVTAGKPRTTGMSRNDLVTINQRIIQSCAEAIRNLAPNAIVIVVTNPLDDMTQAMLQATDFPRTQVLGMAGTLDSSRFRVALAAAAGCNARDVQALTLGNHGDDMVPLTSMAKIKGRSVETVLAKDVIEDCVNQAIHGGGAVVALRKTGSATIAPAHAVIEVLEHLRGARKGWIPVSVRLDGEFGLSDVVLGVPAHLGQTGLLRVEELSLSAEEHSALQKAFGEPS